MTEAKLNPLVPEDCDEIAAAFSALGWNKPKSKYETYHREQTIGQRSVLVARINGSFAGYVTILWQAHYPPFMAKGVPEISDLNVLPQFRGNGVGAQLVLECETLAKARGHGEIGLGVGLVADYGSAQRLYFRLGYVPDGRGLHYGTQPIQYSQQVVADDDLVIYLTKRF